MSQVWREMLILMSIEINRSMPRGNLSRNSERIISRNGHWRGSSRNVKIQRQYRRGISLIRDSVPLGTIQSPV
jgi:hypothetical protein